MIQDGVDPELIIAALDRVQDGNVFERFAQTFLAAERGGVFVPVGGIHDRGIDGLEHTFTEEGGVSRTVYQSSIQADARQKIRDSIRALKKNEVDFGRFIYVTSRVVADGDKIVDDMWRDENVGVWINDARWFGSHVNDSHQTVGAYRAFIEDHFHEFERPGKSIEVADFSGDPRLYVFLRQMLDETPREVPLETVLVDSLILFALEGTDP